MTKLEHELTGYKSLKAYFDEREKIQKLLPAPATLFPTPYNRCLFDYAYALAPLLNDLCNSMVRNTTWLMESYTRIQQVDEFVKRFVDISRRVYIEGPKNIQTCLKAYVVRSDYLPYKEGDQLRLGQVEINLSSVVGPDVVQDLADYHKDMIVHYSTDPLVCDAHRVPENKPRSKFGKFISLIPSVYRKRFGLQAQKLIVLFVTGNTEGNLSEIYAEVREVRNYGILTYCITFDDLVSLFDRKLAQVKIAPGGEYRLFIESLGLRENDHNPTTFEVCCVYWRTAYRPEQYPTERHWEIREELELSEAVVIPSAISQLAGLKKVQQLWCQNKHLETLVKSDVARSLLTGCFVDQVDPADYYNDEHTKELVDKAMQHPESFVLKPQREGGANNFYKAAIPPLLEKEKDMAVSSYILMQRIPALTHKAEYIRDTCLYQVDRCISELGVYGAALWNGETCEFNSHLGHLLRTKPENVDEGGVSINAAVFDSPYLVDE